MLYVDDSDVSSEKAATGIYADSTKSFKIPSEIYGVSSEINSAVTTSSPSSSLGMI